MVVSRIAALLLLASCAACASPGQQQVANEGIPSTITLRDARTGQTHTITRGQALFAAAVIEYRRRNYVRAVEMATQAIDSGQLAGTGLARGHSVRGYAVFALSDAARAREDWQRALALEPTDIPALRGMALISHMQRRPAEVAQYMARAIAADPQDPENYIMRGMFALADRRVTTAALADFDKAIELRPTSASAFYHRGLYNHMSGRLLLARQDYTKALDVNPGESRARAGLELLDRQARMPTRPPVPATPKIFEL